jgi:hypothetical protein
MIAARSSDCASGRFERPVVVAVRAVRMMQVPADQVVDVIAMRHGFMPAARAVNVVGGMGGALMLRRAGRRVGRADLDDVLIDVIAMHVMQVAVVQVVDMAVMTDRAVTAVRPVLVIVVGVFGAVRHFRSPVAEIPSLSLSGTRIRSSDADHGCSTRSDISPP